MDDGDLTAPIVTEFFGKDVGVAPQRSVPAVAGPTLRLSRDAEESVCPPLHRMHERRVVRSAGHMVIGVKMPSPENIATHVTQSEDGAALFYSREQGRTGGVASRAALVLACAVVLGGAALVIEGINREDKSSAQRSALRETSSDVTASVAPKRAIQLLAMSEAPAENVRMAALSPAMVADDPGASPSGFVRVAQKDTPGLIATNVFGPAGAPIRLPVSLNGGRAEDYSFLMFRGLPPEVTLSAGFRLKESWAVSLRDMDNLFIEAPAQFQGAFKLEILLIKGRDTPAESRMITVEVVPADIQIPPTASVRQQPAPGPQVLTAAPRTIEPVERAIPAERQAAPSAPKTARGAAQPSSIAPQQEEMMMQRAAALLASKDVMSARLVLEHLATNGSAKGALTMAKTFDPAYLEAMGVSGIKPDVAKASQWYRRAADLGETEASARLNALASR